MRFATAIVLLLGGCTTQIDLSVDSVTTPDMRRVRIELSPNGPAPTEVRVPEDAEFPFSLGIRPAGEEDAEIVILVSGYVEGVDAPYVSIARAVEFIPGRTRTVQIVLGDPCTSDSDCPGDLLCIAEVCTRPVDAEGDAGRLPEIDAGPAVVAGPDECNGRDDDADGTIDEDEPCVLAAGGDHTCAVQDERLRCWGLGRDGQLGNGSRTSSGDPVSVETAEGWTDVAAGPGFTCGVREAAVQCWGNGEQGQLGPDSTGSLEPVRVAAANGATEVAAGDGFACALLADGGVTCWGRDDRGQLGGSNPGDVLPRVDVPPASAIAAGDDHACALLADGGVQCWGDNTHGQLGVMGSRTEPTVPTKLMGETAIAIAAGTRHTCAILDGAPRTVACWGTSMSGANGPENAADFDGPAELALGDDFSCVRSERGAVSCWGSHDQLTLGPAASADSRDAIAVDGVQDAGAIAAGRDHVCAQTRTGTWCWGSDGSGQLGRGATLVVREPIVVPLGFRPDEIALGDRVSCARSATDVVCWGDGRRARVGDGMTQSRSLPVTILSGSAGALRAGYRATGAMSFGNGATAWGYAADSRLGVPMVDTLDVPTELNVRPAPGLAFGERHGCVADGSTVLCFGLDDVGQLGALASGARPTTVPGTAGFGPQLTAGRTHTCSVEGSRVRCWGDNRRGQCGVSPVTMMQVAEPSILGSFELLSMDAGGENTCAIDASNTLRCWGDNTRGQLQAKSDSFSSRPVPMTEPSWDGVNRVAVGERFVCALASAPDPGALFCWGANDHGQLGDPDQVDDRSAASKVIAEGTFSVLDVGYDHACAYGQAAAEEGRLICWGFDGDGAVGSDRTLNFDTPEQVP